MKKKQIHKSLTYLIAAVWFLNGLFAKVLNFVPRHEEIVARILGEDYSHIIIKAIGIGEIFLAIWILTRIKSRISAALQIFLVATMNILEFLFARDLLLWGGLNAFIAFIFICLIYYNEFILGKNLNENI